MKFTQEIYLLFFFFFFRSIETSYFRNSFRDWISSKSIIGRLRGKERNLNLYWSENVLWSLLLNSVVFCARCVYVYIECIFICWRHSLTKIRTTWNIKIEILSSLITCTCELILRRGWIMDKKLKSGIVTSVYQASRWKFVLIWVDKISIFFLMENFIGKKKIGRKCKQF